MATPTFDVEFTKDGDVFQQPQVDALLAGLGPVTDLLVLSHGWNNDKADASQLYEELLGNIDKLLDLRNQTSVPAPLQGFVDRLRNRNFAAVRVFWPSKKFTDADLIPGGGAASAAAEAENAAAVNRILDRLKDDPHVLGGADRNPAHVAAMEQREGARAPARDDRRKEGIRQASAEHPRSVDEGKRRRVRGLLRRRRRDVVRECSNTRRRARGSRRRGGGWIQPRGRRSGRPWRPTERRSGRRASHR